MADGNELATAFDSLSSGLASTGAASSALGLDITSVPTLMAMALARYAGPRCESSQYGSRGRAVGKPQECTQYRRDHRDRRRLSSRRRVRLFAPLAPPEEGDAAQPHRAWDQCCYGPRDDGIRPQLAGTSPVGSPRGSPPTGHGTPGRIGHCAPRERHKMLRNTSLPPMDRRCQWDRRRRSRKREVRET